MGARVRPVVDMRTVIVSPKKPSVQVLFRWDPDLVDEIRRIATATNRTVNDVGQALMRSAVERSKAELEASGVMKPLSEKQKNK